MGFLKNKINIGMLNEYHDHANYYVPKYNLLFLNIPKVASSTMWSMAAQLQDGFDTQNHQQVRNYKLPSIQSSKIQEYPDVRKIAFVRNPFDRLVSVFQNKIEANDQAFLVKNRLDKGLSFEDFIAFVCSIQDENADKHFRSQFTYLYDYEGNCIIDFLGRLEFFQEDIQQLQNLFELPNLEIPHWNKTQEVDYKSYYSKESQNKVEKRYTLDLQLLGYTFENGLDPSLKENWKKPLSIETKVNILSYKTKKLLRVVRYKEKFDAFKGIKGFLLRKYYFRFTDYFEREL